jgi:hypothetical protein
MWRSFGVGVAATKLPKRLTDLAIAELGGRSCHRQSVYRVLCAVFIFFVTIVYSILRVTVYLFASPLRIP